METDYLRGKDKPLNGTGESSRGLEEIFRDYGLVNIPTFLHHYIGNKGSRDSLFPYFLSMIESGGGGGVFPDLRTPSVFPLDFCFIFSVLTPVEVLSMTGS